MAWYQYKEFEGQNFWNYIEVPDECDKDTVERYIIRNGYLRAGVKIAPIIFKRVPNPQNHSSIQSIICDKIVQYRQALDHYRKQANPQFLKKYANGYCLKNRFIYKDDE